MAYPLGIASNGYLGNGDSPLSMATRGFLFIGPTLGGASGSSSEDKEKTKRKFKPWKNIEEPRFSDATKKSREAALSEIAKQKADAERLVQEKISLLKEKKLAIIDDLRLGIISEEEAIILFDDFERRMTSGLLALILKEK